MLKQLFDTAAEIVQGPNRGNQKLLLESEILLDVNQLWMRQRIDEFTFRALLQDNEDLFEAFMKLLESMRLCEISVLKFLMSLLEEEGGVILWLGVVLWVISENQLVAYRNPYL